MSLIEKISTLAKTLPSLKKGDANKDFGFSFVSIDDYYEKIARAVVGGGVYWTTTQVQCEVVPSRDGPIVNSEYRFTVYDTSNTEDVLAINLFIQHPFQGAQTSGSSLSYADKLLMRSLFKVVTGEPDADALAQRADRRKERPREEKGEAKRGSREIVGETTAAVMTDAQFIFDDLYKKFDECATVEELGTLLVKERKSLNKLKSLSPDLHSRLQKIYHHSIESITLKEKDSANKSATRED